MKETIRHIIGLILSLKLEGDIYQRLKKILASRQSLRPSL
jgi:hypothetical protein